MKARNFVAVVMVLAMLLGCNLPAATAEPTPAVYTTSIKCVGGMFTITGPQVIEQSCVQDPYGELPEPQLLLHVKNGDREQVFALSYGLGSDPFIGSSWIHYLVVGVWADDESPIGLQCTSINPVADMNESRGEIYLTGEPSGLFSAKCEAAGVIIEMNTSFDLPQA